MIYEQLLSSDQESNQSTEERGKKKEQWEGGQEGPSDRRKRGREEISRDREKQIQMNKWSEKNREESKGIISAILEFLFAFSWIPSRAFHVHVKIPFPWSSLSVRGFFFFSPRGILTK